MNLVRKGFVQFLSTVLFISLFGGALAVSLNSNFSTPDNLKIWLSESKIYDHFIDGQLEQAQKDNSQRGDGDAISLNDEGVRKAAEQALTPELLESSVNSFLDGNYAWLQGKTDKPEFQINLKDAKLTFAQAVGKYVENRLSTLPACTPAQLQQLQIPFDPLSVECRPATLVPADEGARITTEITEGEFLKEAEITPETLNQDDKGQPQTPYYKEFSNAPRFFQLGQKLPILLTLLAAITAAGIVFMAPTKRRGLRRIGVVLAEAGILLVATKFLADAAASRLQTKLANGGDLNPEVKQSSSDLADTIANQLTNTNFILGLIMLAVAVAIFVWLYKSREQGSRPTKTVPENTPLENEHDVLTEDDLPKSNTTIAPSRPSMDISGPPALGSSSPPRPPLRNADDVPRIKRPPQQKPPRLIQ